MNNPITLEVTNLSKRYNNQFALNDFNLRVNKGEIVGVAGPNGAGKTTLFRIITGMTPMYEGQVQLFGSLDEAGLRDNRRFLGTIIEDPAFFPTMTAQENLEYYRRQRGVGKKERIPELLTLVGLDDVGNKKVKGFSLGMKQRLAIALALIHDPELLVFDEPTNGLDPSGIIQVRQLLQKLAKETDLTILVSSHILSELENLATRFIIVNHGQKVEEFTKEELHTRLKGFLEVKVDQNERAATFITSQYPDTTVEYDDSSDSLRIYDQAIEPAEIAKLLVNHDIALHHLAFHQRNLEDMFMQLTDDVTGKGEIL